MSEEVSLTSTWSWEQEKAFEDAVATHAEDGGDDLWEKIAALVPGKTVEDVKKHHEVLVEDIDAIESGRVPLPCYVSSSEEASEEGARTKKAVGGLRHGEGKKGSKLDQERRKGIAWTEEEHRLFLMGLEKYGKGDWRSISRNFVITRTPTQVASHAQKYFIRLTSMNKDRRRSSIHDITSVNNGDIAMPQAPITGQANGTAVGPAKTTSKQPPHPRPASTGSDMYATPTIGQPIGGPFGAAVGTPVNLPVHPHMAYGVHSPISRPMVSGAPVKLAPTMHSMQQAPALR